ncbi:MAG: gamma-glutamyltransferase [Sphingomonadales bacterium]
MRYPLVLAAILLGVTACDTQDAETDSAAQAVNLSPAEWDTDVLDEYNAGNLVYGADKPVASGRRGAVSGTYSAPAMQAGLEALKQGGTAADAAIVTALTQISLAAGSWVSYAGFMTVLYYDAASGETYNLNAGWDTVEGETDPMTIPVANQFTDPFGGTPSGRSALVPGFMRGAEALHKRFGKLEWATLFEPAIYYAENGFEVGPYFANILKDRKESLSRLPDTRAIFTNADGEFLQEGDLFRQPDAARTLRAVAANGADYMYTGPWGQEYVAAIKAEGGRIAQSDLDTYEARWLEPVRGSFNGYTLVGNGIPSMGGVHTIEALNLLEASGILENGHWTENPETFFWVDQMTRMMTLGFLEDEVLEQLAPGIDLSPEGRLRKETAEDMWSRMAEGEIALFKAPLSDDPKHSDAIVVVDRHGNAAAVVHTINTIFWGRTGISAGGIVVPDPASFQQAQIAKVTPGDRLPDPTTPVLVFRDDALKFVVSDMGAGLHPKMIQSLANTLYFGMDVKKANDTPALMLQKFSPDGSQQAQVAAGEWNEDYLDRVRKLGLDIHVAPQSEWRFGRGQWVAISIDPKDGGLRATASQDTNGSAVAY